jgi:hypothetical protein
MGQRAWTGREGSAQGGRRAPARRGPHGWSAEALTALADQLLVYELALARRDGSAFPGGLAGLIADDFEEFGASGRRWDRAAVLALLERTPSADVTIGAFTATPLTEQVILVTFRTASLSEGSPPRYAWRSSIWARRGGGWRLRFHQATPTTMHEADAAGH